MSGMEQLHYKLQCVYCGKMYEDLDEGFMLGCEEEHIPSLLRAHYFKQKISFQHHLPGIFRFSDWLPARRTFEIAHGPIVYQSKQLCKLLNLDNFYIVFNGYWPEKGAFMETCTFKELEAPGVCSRLSSHEERSIVVSSAGNTARAFINACSFSRIPAVIVVPESGMSNLWSTNEPHSCVQIVSVTGGADYLDAIHIGDIISKSSGYFCEGGAKNVGRRDGMGTVLLAAIEKLGVVPDHYFQAVGSGTGGIATWEMSLRLLKDGRFGKNKMKLHLVQNAPFTIMYDAWQRESRSLPFINERSSKRKIASVYAKVLSNRKPPFSVVGGVYDALQDTSGHMYSVNNSEAVMAGNLFMDTEGCDLDPAAEVAFAGLIHAVKMKRVKRKDLVVLNITGGGYDRLKMEKEIFQLKPTVTVDIKAVNRDRILHELGRNKLAALSV